jgi:protein-S-isoprenylcysteine O-methyltransferase Ste14
MNKHLKAFMGVVSATPVIFLLGMATALLAYFLFPYPIYFAAQNIFLALGIVLLVGGTATVFWANKISRLFHKSLVMHTCFDFMRGPYRYSRHPGALSMILMFLGFAFIANSITVIILTLVIFVLLTFVFIPMEERALMADCKESYEDYKNRVRMWL